MQVRSSHAGILATVALMTVGWAYEVGADSDYIEPAALAKLIAARQAPLLIDVRSPDEYAQGHVPGALMFPIQAFPAIINRLPQSKSVDIVVYCEKGPRAGLAKAALVLAGYKQIRYLDGHMAAWRASGQAIEK